MRKGIYLDKRTNKWYISTRIKVNDKYHTCTIRGFNSKKEANANYDFEITKWKNEHNYCECDDNYESLRDDYIRWVKHSNSPRTSDRERTQFNTYFDKIFSNNTINNIFSTNRLRIIYRDIRDIRTLNDRKKHDLVMTFRGFTKFCYHQKVITNELYQDIDIIFQPIKYSKVVVNEKRVIPPNELKAILGAINPNHKDLPTLTLFACSGLRIGEFLGICKDCYDREKQTIEIKRQYTVRGELTDKLKTNNSYRTIYLPKNVCDLLNEYIDNNSFKNQDRLFKYSHTDFTRKIHHYEKIANVPLYSPHEYRHTIATNLASKCESYSDIVIAANYLGHSVSMFSDRYCNHFKQKDMKDLIERL